MSVLETRFGRAECVQLKDFMVKDRQRTKVRTQCIQSKIQAKLRKRDESTRQPQGHFNEKRSHSEQKINTQSQIA